MRTTLAPLLLAVALAGLAAWAGVCWALSAGNAGTGCKTGSMRFTDEGGVQICAPR